MLTHAPRQPVGWLTCDVRQKKAFIRHFIRVPQLPHEIRDQFNAAEVVEYLTPEKGTLKEGQPIVRMKTWWAVFDIISTAKGRIEKNLYDNPAIRGCRIAVGDPLSLVFTRTSKGVMP